MSGRATRARHARARRTVLVSPETVPSGPAIAGLLAIFSVGTSTLAWLVDPRFAIPVFVAPVMLTALRFGARAGTTAGLLACGLAWLAGSEGGDVVAAAIVLPLIGVTTGLLASARADQRSHEVARERAIVERERALARERAELVQLISHELRTPLTVIRGSIETLRSRPEHVSPDYHDLLDAARRSTTRLEEMLQVILAAADELEQGADDRAVGALVSDELAPVGRDRRAPIRVDLAALTRDAAASIRPELVGRLELILPSDRSVVAVEPELWLTVRCLLDNAAKFAPADQPIEVRCEHEAGDVVLSVRDRGPGMPPGFGEAAFQPFTQGDTSLVRQHPGMGMGLYTARRLAQRLGGDLELASGEDGVTATVRLPQHGRMTASSSPPSVG